jgi:hypothetical protein
MFTSDGLYQSLISEDMRPKSKRSLKILACIATLGMLGISLAYYKAPNIPPKGKM